MDSKERKLFNHIDSLLRPFATRSVSAKFQQEREPVKGQLTTLLCIHGVPYALRNWNGQKTKTNCKKCGF